ncbi:DUF3021 domain-containing protein [Listeria welshimeri]|uniref:DUF3021 domain-containing protein n=2 Tax=Listeria welshimeri TaxID=1643 RepID=A0ABX4IHP7_LISWE|nr:DUF3021 family protein [Listeria welshimeri]MBC1243021.1 DUF3021 domain-containing protein [Listeria welshimeri]MBC1249634.1 DUF3021 domain-containing protein [Listeria welshimeri]MBC1342060.1 DUF3021 domain-containing protein [Listeria welshimeri]MBC1344518.1 DUF3021 domain-containing protein [Listeria welshimeri]MBC1345314.1 DUF3021 domain-containing protein [Listeria welshimeri]
MRDKLIEYIQTFSVIFTGSIITTTFSYMFSGHGEDISIQDIIALLIFSLVVIIFQQVLFNQATIRKRTFTFRMIIYFFFVEAAILGIGWMLNWYSTLTGFLSIFVFVSITFFFMYLFFHMQDRKVSNEINQKLAEMREKEIK